jgi:hypothetical protein
MIQQILFPWQGTIRRLELGKRWWHRLTVVLFVSVLIVTLLVTWAVMMDTGSANVAEFDQWGAHSWYVDGSGARVDIPPPPPGFQPLVTAGEARPADRKDILEGGLIPTPAWAVGPVVPIHYRVLMPDGKTKEFVGKSIEEIKAEWDAAAENAALHRLNVRRGLLSPLVAVLVTLAVSYLLQSLYRVLLYVVYGSHKHVTP